ncbi:MAG: hypothetical protein MUF34_28670 [Polyangiaceae bacterium]|jgi:hypothetical protein|nr:hypothetical protein [Polyangiaceae bacterium]
MGESATPLSELIERCLEPQNDEADTANFERFLQAFAGSRLGVIVVGNLQGAKRGESYVTREGQASCATVTLPGNKLMLLACADRPSFLRKFARRFNADVDARTLITIALANPSCQGIMLNSALSDRSIALARTLLPGLLERCKAVSAPPAEPLAWKRTTLAQTIHQASLPATTL